eukprot:scaffold2295_cov354-Prasinococcus_capsulatus_cf.AAC.20
MGLRADVHGLAAPPASGGTRNGEKRGPPRAHRRGPLRNCAGGERRVTVQPPLPLARRATCHMRANNDPDSARRGQEKSAGVVARRPRPRRLGPAALAQSAPGPSMAPRRGRI